MSKRKKSSSRECNQHQETSRNRKKIQTSDDRIKVKKKISITAKNENQINLIKSINKNTITIASGCAGTGKTRISVLLALSGLVKENYKKIIFTRPCVEAEGENLGFLPGDFNDKIQPYMMPIFDFLYEYLEDKEIDRLIEERKLLTLPLAYQRGVTFEDAFVILDESQNCTTGQLRMFLTRIGHNTKVVITGDPMQSDIKGSNGLDDICDRLKGLNSLDIINFTVEDVLRNPIVMDIENRYRGEK